MGAMTEPEVLFLPFAVPEPLGELVLDDGVLARRLADLLHVLLNELAQDGTADGCGSAPAGMLEIQSPPGDGTPRWVTLLEPPEPVDVLAMLGPQEDVRALVAGSLSRPGPELLALDLTVHLTDDGFAAELEKLIEEDDDELPDGVGPDFEALFEAAESRESIPLGIRGLLRLDDPVPGLLRIVDHLAAVLGLVGRRLGPGTLGASPDAFYRLLAGLDGAALLGGDLELEPERHGDELLLPLVEALELDPAHRLAMRTLASSLFSALEGERIDDASCLRLIDRALLAGPRDSEGCVGIAEQLTMLGDRERAAAWLEHAVAQQPPAPRALESLGVLLANRGDTGRAQELWRQGSAGDGAPDFSAHLARLAFAERRVHDAWSSVLEGLRRTWERAVRRAEWPGLETTPSVLLRYLSEHLDRGDWPDELERWLTELVGQLREPQARVDLGVCLAKIGDPEQALSELQAGLAADVGPSVTDRGVRALLALQIPGFEKRFALATESAVKGRDPRGALVELQAYLEHRPDFWPALFYVGVALKRLGHTDDAIDVMAEVLDRRPGQVDALTELADMFAARGNAKRALECVDEALVLHPELADLHLKRARFLEQLGRARDASRALDRAVDLDRN
jgi:tetratricopeptide (TPR) repeat protein